MQKLIKNAKNGPFWLVTRQVNFNRTKIGGKCQNWIFQMRHFEVCGQTVLPDRSLLIAQKFDGKCQNWISKMRHFEWFLNTVWPVLPYCYTKVDYQIPPFTPTFAEIFLVFIKCNESFHYYSNYKICNVCTLLGTEYTIVICPLAT